MRQRLIDLLRDNPYLDVLDDEKWELAVEHLLANGVIVPPVNVGQMVWFIRHNDIIETCIEKIIIKHGGLYIKLWCNSAYETTCRSIGKTVFLTKEEALQALAERGEAT